MSVPLVGDVLIVPVVSAIEVISVLAPEAAAPRLVRAVAAEVAPVPPFAMGRVPVTCVVRLTPESEPPSVNDPLDVTVPVSVIPLTEPVPPTDVTVPTFDVYPEGLLAGYSPKFVRAVAASVAPVPPLATARVPANVIVPAEVIGPPEAVRPVVPPETLTLVTVPAPATASQIRVEPFHFKNVSVTVGAYQGTFGIIGDVSGEEKDVAKMINDDIIWLNKNRSEICKGIPALENIIDELTSLHMKTLYKLENLR